MSDGYYKPWRSLDPLDHFLYRLICNGVSSMLLDSIVTEMEKELDVAPTSWDINIDIPTIGLLATTISRRIQLMDLTGSDVMPLDKA